MSNPIAEFFGLSLSRPNGNAALPDIFPMPILCAEFVDTDVETIFAKILTDVVDRCEGIPEEAYATLWDNCLGSETPEGLITILAKAMAHKAELFLVYTMGVVRKATSEETATIRREYKVSGKSSTGVYISFSRYRRTDMVRLYSALEYYVISSLYKGVNLSKAVQYKISEMRSSIGASDAATAIAQGTAVATALSKGRDVMLDAKDSIESHQPDLDATKQSIEFLDSKRCFYLGLPRAYVNGESSGGLGDSGIGEAKAVERGLKSYFVSIIRPVMQALYGVAVSFRPTDLAQTDTALEALKTFELIGDSYLSTENKKLVIQRLLAIK